jgi:hypothetical protein
MVAGKALRHLTQGLKAVCVLPTPPGGVEVLDNNVLNLYVAGSGLARPVWPRLSSFHRSL